MWVWCNGSISALQAFGVGSNPIIHFKTFISNLAIWSEVLFVNICSFLFSVFSLSGVRFVVIYSLSFFVAAVVPHFFIYGLVKILEKASF